MASNHTSFESVTNGVVILFVASWQLAFIVLASRDASANVAFNGYTYDHGRLQ